MPRYVVERTFPEGLDIPAGREGAELCMDVVDRNAESGVTWVHSYVSADNARTFCVYDAPAPEAVRKTASRNDLPIDRITEVRVLDPYFRAARRLGSQRPGRSVAVLRPGEQARDLRSALRQSRHVLQPEPHTAPPAAEPHALGLGARLSS